MYAHILNKLNTNQKPIDVIVVGLGFMGFGFLSHTHNNLQGMRIPLVISRRPEEAVKFLKKHKVRAKIENNPKKILKNVDRGIISVSDDLNLIEEVTADVVFEVTGTVGYGTEAALKALNSGKHLVTMNPELQATVGTELKKIADQNGLVISDVAGDQPGSLATLIGRAKLMGFEILVAGNMKRFMNKYATQKEMKPWADDKGLAVRQTTSFTDGTKQSIEMNLLSNHFGLSVLERGMQGPEVEEVHGAVLNFDLENIPEGGVVDYVIGKSLFPGVFLICKHSDPNQQKYLRYLGLGEGPWYTLFEPYHLCHLEVPSTIAKVVLFKEETINNGLNPKTRTITLAKANLKKGSVLDGIGGDTVYGMIAKENDSKELLPVGLSEGAVLTKSIKKDQTIKISDVILPDNAATRLLGFVKSKKSLQQEVVVTEVIS